MGRNPRSKQDLNRGAWTAEEDRKLAEYIKNSGETGWRTLPKKAGLNRCGKSCRLRWLNYLRPDIKRGNITQDEEELIIRMHRLLGNRWALIAGRLPGRTDNEIKNYWNTHLSKKLAMSNSSSEKSMLRSCSFPAAVADRHHVHKQQTRASSDIVQDLGEVPSTSASRSQSCDGVELSESTERMAMSWLEESLLNDLDIRLLNSEDSKDAFNSSMETDTRIDFRSEEFSLENLLEPVIDNRIPKDEGEAQTRSDVESIFKEIINEEPEWMQMQMQVVECCPSPPPPELQMLECLLSSEVEGLWPPHHDYE